MGAIEENLKSAYFDTLSETDNLDKKLVASLRILMSSREPPTSASIIEMIKKSATGADS
jgi:hypothetical protein